MTVGDVMYEERVYRNLFKGINLKFFDICVYETDLRIGSKRILSDEALVLVKKYRKEIEDYIALHPEFLKSLEPVECLKNAPFIVRQMIEASKKVGVGPMATVAGGLSELVGIELLNYSDEIIVENGGDIFIKTSVQRKVGVYAGKSPLSEKIAIVIEPHRTPMGICTSSGTVGHSLSFGKADAVVVLSKDTFLSDAAATSVCNMVKDEEDIEKAVEYAGSIEGVEGVLIIMGGKMGAWGDISITGF